MTNTTNRPCPECGAVSVPDPQDDVLSVCTHCQMTFSPGTADWPEDVKQLNYNAHPLVRDLVGVMVFQDPGEFDPRTAPERAAWAFKLFEEFVTKLPASAWMRYARLAPDFAGGTLFDRRDVAYALHNDHDAGDPLGVPEEDIAKVTEAEQDGAAAALEDWIIFSNGQDWPDMLQDARDMGRFE